MNKYAVISVGDKQYTVRVGEVLEVQKLDGAAGTVIFDQVLLVVDGETVRIGTPTVQGMSVTATYIEDKKGDKVQVFKYKSKSKYRKLRGARQTYSYLKIDAIGTPEKKTAAPKAEKAAPKKPAVKKSPSVKTE